MSKRSMPDIFLGLGVMLTLVVVIALSLKAANLTALSEGDTYVLTARFDNVGGLKARATVRSSGFVVGRVKTISLDAKSFQGVVELAIMKGYVFPSDSSAKIQTTGLLGDQYIGLVAGDDTLNLKPGDLIKTTYSAVVLEQLIRQFLTGQATDLVIAPAKSETKKP
jgi:phospholipid/cholesterol/gamma-HCH transport system substrate-binding protein